MRHAVGLGLVSQEREREKETGEDGRGKEFGLCKVCALCFWPVSLCQERDRERDSGKRVAHDRQNGVGWNGKKRCTWTDVFRRVSILILIGRLSKLAERAGWKTLFRV